MTRTIEQDKAWTRQGRAAASALLLLLHDAQAWTGEAADCNLPAALAPEALAGDNAGLTADQFAAAVGLANQLITLLLAPGPSDTPSGRATLNLIKLPQG